MAQASSPPLASPATEFLPVWKLSTGTCLTNRGDPRAHPRQQLSSMGLLTRGPWLSASPPAAAPCLPWDFGMVPPFLHALYHSRAHPTAAPSRRMFAECLQVARQRSRELIFLLIKGRKNLFVPEQRENNRGKSSKALPKLETRPSLGIKDAVNAHVTSN